MSNTSQKPKNFEPFPSWKELIESLSEETKKLSEVKIWVKSIEYMIQGRLADFNRVTNLFCIAVSQETDLKKFIEEVAKNVSQEWLISVVLPGDPTSHLFFKTKFLRLREFKRLQFDIPREVFKVQRRQHDRYKIPQGHVMRVEFEADFNPGVVQSKKVIDISAGGIAFSTDEKEVNLYSVGQLLKNFQFTVQLKKICVPAEVRQVKVIPSDFDKTILKVGVVLLKMSEAETSLLSSYVFNENIKYFARFL